MRYLLATIVLIPLLLNGLWSQIPEDEIELPDIIILGETEKLIDTISLEQRLRPYWNLDSLREFEYRPALNPEAPEDYEEFVEERNGYLSIFGGNRYFMDFDVMYQSPRTDLLTFYSSFKNREVVTGRPDRLFRAGWLPSYHQSDFALNASYRMFSDEMEWLENTNTVINDLAHYTVSLSFLREDSADLPLPVKDIFIEAAFNNYQQETFNEDTNIVEEEINDIDIHGSMTIPLTRPFSFFSLHKDDTDQGGLSIPLEIVLLKKNTFGINIGLRKDNLAMFDYLGLNIIADSYGIVPSVALHSKLDVNSYLRLILVNEPDIDSRTRSVFLLDNPDQNINMNKRLVKTPLNASLILENDRAIPLSLSYSIRWNKDYLFYGFSEMQWLFAQYNTDLLEQEISFSLAYRYRDLQLSNTLNYLIQEKKIPFIPEWNNKTTLGWYGENSQIWCELEYIAERTDLIEENMDEVFLLSLSTRRQIISNLSVEAGIYNILREPYRKYELYESLIAIPPSPYKNQIPEEPLSFKAGLIWRF